MGRSLMFSYNNISKPAPISIDVLSLLKRRFIVSNFSIKKGIESNEFMPSTVTRSPSTYKYRESLINPGIQYIVDNDNYDPTLFAKTGLRAFALRDVSIQEDNHIATWIITTDGYVRESEDYGIIGYINTIEVSDDEVVTKP